MRFVLCLCVLSLSLRMAALDLATAADKALRKHVAANEFSGAVLVSQGGRVLLKRAYGASNLELQTPNEIDTKFRIGSISKTFTAAAVLLLAEQRKLSRQAKLCEYLSECPAEWMPITVHQLLTHTSGIPELLSLAEFKESLTVPSLPAQTARRLMKYPLAFPPGQRFNYSNSDYILLAVVIEKAAGISFPEFVRQNILTRLRMDSTGQDDARTILDHRASGYMRRDGKIINAEYIDMSIPLGGGAMYSTIEDLAKWKNVFIPGRLLSRESIDAMLTAHTKADWGDGVGYGWFIGTDPHGHPFHAHLGGINGFAANVRYYPVEDLYVVVLSNRSFAPIDPMTEEIVQLAFSQK